MKYLHLIGLGFFSVSVAACSLPLKSHAPPEQIYRLNPVLPSAVVTAAWDLYVAPVTVDAALNSDRLVLIKPPVQQDFIAHSRWPATLGTYLHDVTVDALRQTGQFHSVTQQFVARQRGLKLALHVERFQAEYPTQANALAAVEVSLTATWIRTADQRVLQQNHYQVRKPQIAVSTSALVQALNIAYSEALVELIRDVPMQHFTP